MTDKKRVVLMRGSNIGKTAEFSQLFIDVAKENGMSVDLMMAEKPSRDDPPFLLDREGVPKFKHRVEALIKEKAAKRAEENAKRDMNREIRDMDYRK